MISGARRNGTTLILYSHPALQGERRESFISQHKSPSSDYTLSSESRTLAVCFLEVCFCGGKASLPPPRPHHPEGKGKVHRMISLPGHMGRYPALTLTLSHQTLTTLEAGDHGLFLELRTETSKSTPVCSRFHTASKCVCVGGGGGAECKKRHQRQTFPNRQFCPKVT